MVLGVLLHTHAQVPHRNICFELWGFDILLDQDMRAWLMEVNTSPALNGDTAVDRRVKGQMLREMLHLVGVVPYDRSVYNACSQARRQERLTGLQVALDEEGNAVMAAPPSPGGGGGSAGAARPRSALGKGGSPAGKAQRPSSGTGRAAAAATTKPVQQVCDIDDLDFGSMAAKDLPDVVVEAEAENERRGSWQRVFPCPEEPLRYLDLFSTNRFNNLLLCKYYAQKAGQLRPEKR